MPITEPPSEEAQIAQKEETRPDTPACAGPSKRNQQKYSKKKEKKRQNTQHEHSTTESSSLSPDVPQEGAPVNLSMTQYTLPTASQLDSKNPDLYAISKKMASKEYGVFAACRIPRGTRIMSEEPLIADYKGKNVASLSVIEDVKKSPRDKLLALHALPIQEHHSERYKQLLEWIEQFPGQQPDEDVHENTRQQHYNLRTLISTKGPESELGGEHPGDVLLEKIHLLARVDSNGIWIERREDYGRAVYQDASRINHSCLPNAIHCFNQDAYTGTVHAIRDIEQGEEITIDYLPDGVIDPTDRRSWLKNYHAITCRCRFCSGTGKDWEEYCKHSDIVTNYLLSESRAKKMSVPSKEQSKATWAQIRFRHRHGMRDASMAVMLTYYATFLAQRCKITSARPMQVCLRIMDMKQRAYMIFRDCYGLDHPYVAHAMHESGLLDAIHDTGDPKQILTVMHKYFSSFSYAPLSTERPTADDKAEKNKSAGGGESRK